jgi:HK97 family phage portal protein
MADLLSLRLNEDSAESETVSSGGLISLSEHRSMSLENPAVPLSSPAAFQMLYGGEPTASGELVNESTALQITTVYACVRCLAESVSSLPLKLWERTEQGIREAVDASLHYLLAVEPNPEMSAVTFKEQMIGAVALTGNSYAQIERNPIGQPVALWPLHPLKTRPIRRDNKLLYETSDGEAPGQTRIIDPEDMLHLLLFSLDGIKGISPISMARQSLGLTKAAEKFGARFFGNGSRPGGVLINKGMPSKEKKKESIESWQEQNGGENQGRTAFLFGGEWSYQQIGLSPEDSQFLATRQFQRSEIAALFRIPPHYVGDTSRLSGNNAEQTSLQFVTDTLRPYIGRFEIEIIRKLMPRVGRKANKYFASFDVSERLRGDFKTQQEGFAAGVQWGWYCPNDVRRKLGDNPGPAELDIYRVPVNMTSAKVLLTAGDKAAPSAAPVRPEGEAPTEQERKLLGGYTRSFISIYANDFRQLSEGEKRDYGTISGLFEPVLRSIVRVAADYTGADLTTDFEDETVRRVVQAMEVRAVEWPAAIGQENLSSMASQEFLRAVRSIHVACARKSSEAKAAREVEEDGQA